MPSVNLLTSVRPLELYPPLTCNCESKVHVGAHPSEIDVALSVAPASDERIQVRFGIADVFQFSSRRVVSSICTSVENLFDQRFTGQQSWTRPVLDHRVHAGSVPSVWPWAFVCPH